MPSGLSQAERIANAIKEAVSARNVLSEKHAEDLAKSLAKASNRISAQMAVIEKKIDPKFWETQRLSVLRQMNAEIDAMAKELKSNLSMDSDGRVTSALRLGIEDGVSQLSAIGAPEFVGLVEAGREALVASSFSLIDRQAVVFLSNYELQLLGDVSESLATDIKGAVTQGILTGQSIPQIARGIGEVIVDKDAFRVAGKTIFKRAQTRCTLIARTETIRAHNEGRKAFYQQRNVKQIRWITAHDERLCNVCAPLDGRVFDLGLEPKQHPNCRCTVCAHLPQYVSAKGA